MNDVEPFNPDELPLIKRAKFGVGRGAVIGVCMFGLIWLRAALGKPGWRNVREAPIAAGAAVVLGFAIAGGILLAGKRYVRTLSGAIGLAIACSVPIWLGVLTASRENFAPRALPQVFLVSLLSGAIWGTFAWKGWSR